MVFELMKSELFSSQRSDMNSETIHYKFYMSLESDLLTGRLSKDGGQEFCLKTALSVDIKFQLALQIVRNELTIEKNEQFHR
jgi:hypothetical protein